LEEVEVDAVGLDGEAGQVEDGKFEGGEREVGDGGGGGGGEDEEGEAQAEGEALALVALAGLVGGEGDGEEGLGRGEDGLAVELEELVVVGYVEFEVLRMWVSWVGWDELGRARVE